MSKCFIIIGIKDETTINKLLSDLKIDMNNANISNIVLNNGVLYKINLNNNPYTIQSLMKSFINVRKNNIDLYSKVFLRPDQSYEDRLKCKILFNGASLKPGNIKCIFNIRTLNYELKLFSLNNNRVVIDWTSNVDYSTTEYNKWKSSIDNNQKTYNTNSNGN